MQIKVGRTCYDSSDIPICLFFATYEYKDAFIKDLIKCKENLFLKVSSITGVLAGSFWFSKQNGIYRIKYDNILDAKETQRTLFNTNINSIIYSPEDIPPDTIVSWLGTNEKKFNKMFENFRK